MALKLVPDDIEEDAITSRFCDDCHRFAKHTAKKISYYSPAGFRRLLFWSCEKHPLPDMLSEGDEYHDL